MSENQKKIWITGASSGIGRSLAEKFAGENWKVAISARRENLLNELAEHKNIKAYPLDVTNSEMVNKVFINIINDLENIDLCIFCSGTYDPKLEKEINKDQIKKTMDVNFFGVVNCIKSVETYFKKKKNRTYIDSFINCWLQRPTKFERLWSL